MSGSVGCIYSHIGNIVASKRLNTFIYIGCALLIAVERYPDDPTANYNAACACVMRRRLNDGKRYLAKAGNSRATQYVGNVIKAMEGAVNWKMERNRLIIIDKD